MSIVQTTPTGKPKRSGRRAYGFLPAIEFRGDHTKPGHLVEVSEKGEVLDEWDVQRNDHVCLKMKGQIVVMPKGYPIMAAQLQEAGATVRVHPRLTDTTELAKTAFADAFYL